MSATPLIEPAFRRLATTLYQRIETAFDEVDPDVVECENAQGAITFVLADGAKWVLSMQPPVCQMWLAVASKGKAHHFTYHPTTQQWRDDKNSQIELLEYLRSLLKEEAGIDVVL